MFICTPCLKEKYVNPASSTQSMGLCEFCEQMRACSDIPSSHLTRRRNAVPMPTRGSTGTYTDKNGHVYPLVKPSGEAPRLGEYDDEEFEICQKNPDAALLDQVVCHLENGHDGDCEPRKLRALEEIMTRKNQRKAEKEGIVGFVQGVALLDGRPLLPAELAGKRVVVTIEVLDR